ncbi:MAG TPA: hypothetical protein VEA59_04105 [Patescibacteria group bacterium]|nr:hypothetical protein [Patescibacteria group bacterium]
MNLKFRLLGYHLLLLGYAALGTYVCIVAPPKYLGDAWLFPFIVGNVTLQLSLPLIAQYRIESRTGRRIDLNDVMRRSLSCFYSLRVIFISIFAPPVLGMVLSMFQVTGSPKDYITGALYVLLIAANIVIAMFQIYECIFVTFKKLKVDANHE